MLIFTKEKNFKQGKTQRASTSADFAKFIFSLSLLAIARLKTKSNKIQRVWKYIKNLWVTGVYVCIYVYNSDYLDDNL